jgi:hypothetical protein
MTPFDIPTTPSFESSMHKLCKCQYNQQGGTYTGLTALGIAKKKGHQAVVALVQRGTHTLMLHTLALTSTDTQSHILYAHT